MSGSIRRLSVQHLQCYGMIYMLARGEKEDTWEAWYWITHMVGLQPQQHREFYSQGELQHSVQSIQRCVAELMDSGVGSNSRGSCNILFKLELLYQ